MPSMLAVVIVATAILDLLMTLALLRMSREIRLYFVARRVSETRITRPIRPFDDDEEPE